MKRLGSLFLILSVIIMLAACQMSSGGIGNEPAEEKIKIRIAWWGGDGRHAYTQELLERYTQTHPEVEFEALPSEWDDYFDKLTTQAASGEMPDIVQMDYLYIYTFAHNGSLADLKAYIDDGTILTADMDQRLLDSGCIDGKNVGVPLSTSILCMGYNPQVLESFGLELPDGTWTWPKFLENASAVSASLQKPGVLTSAGITKDTNIFRYWVRQHGEELFNEDGTALGFEDISLTEEFFSMWKDMMDADISPDPDEMAQIISLGQDKGPLVTEDAAYIFEWDNYAVKMSGVNDSLRITLPPLVDGYDHKGLWMKPGMFFSVAQTSKVKDACARFIDWFINSREANDIIMAERGTPVSSKIREYMVQTGRMSAQQIEMFEYVDKASAYCGETPKPDPIGITQVNELFNNAGNRVFYGTASAREAAEDFHTQANAILEKYN